LNVPDVAGDEILRQLKADPHLRTIPVVMISADAIGSRVDELLELGAADYLTKPYKVREFLECIDRTLRE
jgi:CheY-like chemotaxis protein